MSIVLAVPLRPDGLLLRELTSCCLPGKVRRLPPPASTSVTGRERRVDVATVGRGRTRTKTKTKTKTKDTIKKGGLTLQRLGFKEDCPLVLQMLEGPTQAVEQTPPEQSEPQPLSHPPLPLGQIRVWAQLEELDSSSSGGVLAWPPREVVVNGGATPSFGHLLRHLHTAFPLPSSSSSSGSLPPLHVYKHQPQSHTWTRLSSAHKKRGVDSILSPPHSLIDGSLLVLRRAAAPSTGVESAVDRREDMFTRFLSIRAAKQRSKPRQRQMDSSAIEATVESSGSGKEVGLKIGELDLDFSDDNDEGEPIGNS